MKQIILITLTLLCGSLFAQSDDDVLFSVADRDVTVGEFRYIYNKTNGDEADYSRQSLEEYLDLYQRFKLKVARAYDMGLDTVKSLQQELQGYRRQLADNYLMDRAVTDQLVEELYARQQQDIEISHILFQLPKGATEAQLASVKEQVKNVQAQTTPDNFAEMAAKHSADKFSSKNGGKIGYLSAPFPKGMYALESAVYNAQPNTVIGPIKTTFGYHLAMVHGKRPARGEVEAAHIMFRKEKKDRSAAEAKAEIDKVYKLLTAGQDFEKLAATMSEDEKTRSKGGYIGFFGINRYEKGFENAAFGIAEDGGFSEVIESKVGYHILKRISRKGVQPFALERPLLTSKVKADDRFQVATDALLQSIRQRAGLTEDKQLIGQFAAGLQDTSFLTFKWKAPNPEDERAIFTLGGEATTLGEFQQFLQKESRKRVRFMRSGKSVGAVNSLYDEFLEEKLLAYEESKLEENYPDFRALMREYEEGILLFEATKLEVWDKASQDSIGLEQYFNDNRSDYQWKERAVVSTYTIAPAQSDLVGEAMSAARKLAAEDAQQRLADLGAGKGITVRTDNYEVDRMDQLDGLAFKAGAMTKARKDPKTGRQTFYKVEKILPAAPKELNEARGYVIADYQDQLEREWVKSLRKAYKLKMQKRTFEKMVKK